MPNKPKLKMKHLFEQIKFRALFYISLPLVAGLLGYGLLPSWLLASAVISTLAIVLDFRLRQIQLQDRSHLFDLIKWDVANGMAALSISARYGPILTNSSASMCPENLNILSQLLTSLKPLNILEFGPGASTEVVTTWIQNEKQPANFVSVEHDSEWLKIIKNNLDRREIGKHVNLIEAPLADWLDAKGTFRWYQRNYMDALPATLDLIIIDGPPSVDHPNRYPAMAELVSKIHENTIILLDDGARQGEKWAVEQWVNSLGLKSFYLNTLSGLWLIQKK